jgi:alkylhydroperoxidase family enzyme
MSPRVPTTEITGPLGYMVKSFSKKKLGAVPAAVGVMWHNRKVLTDMSTAGRKAEKWDRVDPNLKTYAHMAAVGTVGCSFCLDFGYFQAHNEGLDVAKASEVPRWRESTVFTSLERDVMEYAEGMSRTPLEVTDELSARLLDQLGAAALIELTAWIAFANMASRANVALGIESEEFSKACALPLARPSTGHLVSP